MSTEAIYAKYWSALMDVEAVMVPADTAIALALRLAVADAYAAGLDTCSGMDTDLAAIVASQQQALQNALEQIDPLREERNALLLQLAQLDAGNADLTQRLANLAGVQAEAERLRQENADLREQVIPDYQNSLVACSTEIDRLTQRLRHDTASNGNGAGVDPTTASEWNRNHPAWDGMTDEERIALYELTSGRAKFGELSLAMRTEILARVLRHAMDGAERLTMAQFDNRKPEWMPMASGLVKVFGGKWPKLLDLAAATA